MSGRYTVLTTDELDEWFRYYERVGEPGPYHHPEYLDLLAGDFEHDEERAELFVYEDEDELVYYPYLRRPVSTVPFGETLEEALWGYDDVVSSWYYGGPVASEDTDERTTDAFADAFSTYCAETGIVAEFVRFDPNLENHEDFPALDPQHNRQTVPVNLNQSADDIWQGYEDRNRRAIKQAQESDVTIDRDHTDEDIAAFHDIYTNAMAARDAAEHYRFRLAFFERILSSDLFDMVVARCDGEVIGGFVIAHDERYSHHFLSASNPDYWDDRVNNLMYHEVVLFMRETGRDVFDFQGGRPGVFKFKKGFAPDRGEFYIGRRVHMEDVYSALCDSAEDAGVNTDSGYFPAYRLEQSN
jgi:hypothetical protein